MNKSRILQNLVPFVELLRNNNAPYFYFGGGSLRDIQMMVGHSSLQTTQRYIESDSESQMKVVNLI